MRPETCHYDSTPSLIAARGGASLVIVALSRIMTTTLLRVGVAYVGGRGPRELGVAVNLTPVHVQAVHVQVVQAQARREPAGAERSCTCTSAGAGDHGQRTCRASAHAAQRARMRSPSGAAQRHRAAALCQTLSATNKSRVYAAHAQRQAAPRRRPPIRQRGRRRRRRRRRPPAAQDDDGRAQLRMAASGDTALVGPSYLWRIV
jgi:hypothetical protein